MQEHEYTELSVRVSIAPQAETWPKPNFAEASIKGEKPSLGDADGPIHWVRIHDAVADARTRLLKVLGSMAAVDEDQKLSPSGKAEKKREIATKAIADFQKSNSLSQAQKSVEHRLARMDEDLGLTPKAPEGVADAMVCAEIRSHLAAFKQPGDRMAFIEANVADIAQAVLTAPAFLSGLSSTELAVVKERVEAHANPEIAKAKQDTIRALRDTEAGWRNAIRQISERGGLTTTSGNGQ